MFLFCWKKVWNSTAYSGAIAFPRICSRYHELPSHPVWQFQLYFRRVQIWNLVGVRTTNKSVVAPPKSIWKNENLIYIPLAITAPTGSSARSRYANRSGPLFIIIVSNRDDSHGKGKGARGSVVRWGGFQDDPLFRFIDTVSMVVVIKANKNEVGDKL